LFEKNSRKIMKNKSWSLDDAEIIAKEAKYTFYKPSKNLISKLQIGNLVKLIFRFETDKPEMPGAERMWVIITDINNGKFTGKLDNDPYYIKDLKHKDVLEFEGKHIIQVYGIDDGEEDLTQKYIHRCMATQKVLYENAQIKWFYREESMGEVRAGIFDTGWRFMAGDETDEYLENPDNLHLVSLGALLNKDDSFVDLLDAPEGSAFGWDDNLKKYRQIYDGEE
jgi:hypothetical protein